MTNYRESVACVTTVGVKAVQTTLPHGPDKSPENVLGTITWTASFVRQALCARYRVALTLDRQLRVSRAVHLATFACHAPCACYRVALSLDR